MSGDSAWSSVTRQNASLSCPYWKNMSQKIIWVFCHPLPLLFSWVPWCSLWSLPPCVGVWDTLDAHLSALSLAGRVHWEDVSPPCSLEFSSITEVWRLPLNSKKSHQNYFLPNQVVAKSKIWRGTETVAIILTLLVHTFGIIFATLP